MNENVAQSTPATLPGDGAAIPTPYVRVARPASVSPRASAPRSDAVHAARIHAQGYWRRKVVNVVMLGFAGACATVALIPLFAIAIYVLLQGATSLNVNFFTHQQADVDFLLGLPRGIGNAIAGTLLLVAIASAIGMPIGLFSGIYLAEYGRGRFAVAVRFLADVMAGIPSIVAGLVGYALVVSLVGFSAVAGGFALGLLMFPVVTRSTEEVLRLVPSSLREAGLALGLPRWRVIAGIVIPSASNGIITSLLLGLARVTGETAPLLFTSTTYAYWQWNPLRPVAALSETIYRYSATYFDPQHHHLAFAGALILVGVVVLLNLTARLLFRPGVSGRT